MSPRAACRLERFGFQRVYDYAAGIADWKAAGLPTEGTAAPLLRVTDATRPDIPTCQTDEALSTAHHRTTDAGWDECIVVDCDGIVVGRLRGRAWASNRPDGTAGEAMELGPTTVRPDGLLHPLVERMQQRETKLVVVTDAQGRLIGALLRTEAERLLSGEPPEVIWQDCDGCPGHWEAQPA